MEILNKLTPVEQHCGFYLKRDDLFEISGIRGGKVRTCFALAQNEILGLTTAGSRSSPQINIVATIAQHLGIKCVAHCPKGDLKEELLIAKSKGADIIQHKAGYNSVIVARSREYANYTGFMDIPFGMECREAVKQTMKQVENIPADVQRIIMPVGSGMSLCGVLEGLRHFDRDIPVLGVMVGAAPYKRINSYAPLGWQEQLSLINAGVDYDKYIDASVGPVILDPVYEAKCAKFLRPGDLLWCVGIRQSYDKAKN